jgi:hypothetical protein
MHVYSSMRASMPAHLGFKVRRKMASIAFPSDLLSYLLPPDRGAAKMKYHSRLAKGRAVLSVAEYDCIWLHIYTLALQCLSPSTPHQPVEVLGGLGGLANGLRLPERLRPGAFDMWGNSHQASVAIKYDNLARTSSILSRTEYWPWTLIRKGHSVILALRHASFISAF